jgi:fructose-1,6-bisphosphatase-3
MATFETYFVADKAAQKETKNSYFDLIHDPAFCRKMGVELGAKGGCDVLIVNGHVPVKLEEGESPVKRSGLAVTIDGAFSEAYGDHGYTLVIAAERTYLAKHHHFESVETAITRGEDIVPEILDMRVHGTPLRVGDTARGDELREEIAALEDLVRAYREHTLEPAAR